MKERPILFTGPMVRAILDGSKTQTRRIMKPQPEPTPADYPGTAGHWWPSNIVQSMVHVEQELQSKHGGWKGFCPDVCPHGRIGDRLWVSEAWARTHVAQAMAEWIVYREGDNRTDYGGPWKPSIHMPRWASRILLEIVSVRVERLQDISEADARAEGVTIEDQHMRGYCAGEFLPPSIRAYRDLWESINGAGSWEANPWVWVVEFKRVPT